MLPVHWGSFSISRHDWWEPPERAGAEAAERGVTMLTPRVGQTLVIDEDMETEEWWREYKRVKD
jgi:L-ascorbate metabolism protein UlaG (beta-lactamase superfamily)